MSSFVRQHKGAVVVSVAMHVAIAAALGLGFRLPARSPQPVNQLSIEAVVVDQNVLNQEIARRERAQREAVQRRQREERQAREAQEAERRRQDEDRRRQEEEVRREQARVAEVQLQRQREEAAARERAEAEKREQQRLADERRQREQREREEAARREREAAAERQRAEAEAQRQRAAAAERASQLDQYVLMIQRRIEQAWIPPASARPGLDCEVQVVQIPSGDVIDVRVGRCNGDEAVVRSIEAAVNKASPLPRPPDPSLFTRNLNVHFVPEF